MPMQAGPDRRSCALRCRGNGSDLALMLALAAVPALAAAADDEPSATPYRPSVSTPATLSAPGWLEIEGGLQHSRDDGASRDSVPVTLKLAFTADWGVRVGADVWARLRDNGGAQTSGYGDTGVVLKRRFAVDDASAFGLEAGVLLPTAHRGVGAGSGKADYGVNAIYSTDFGSSWHTDLNLQPIRLGQIEPDTGRTLWLAAASLSNAIDDKWTLIGEISGSHRHGVANNSQLLLAASYNVSKQLVLDAGAARNLLRGSPSWSAFTGFTWLAWRVF
jgi:hypothetical protein